ncbi:magnesium transporter CorA family protein [Pediococcus claussenii]|uniref:CorA-like Mg2+ transporter family protein n=1 Tax=Pediococcus claussenii (strain ATCC BAA-344 / DSM 14800 / JCM 18046 / KCTC 3811 / LMG 21948 / P06) TaxID=701521 RepID=G8PF16_PEDCP|nr:magnesium transporter CorA family protein [Pediococcus claussenii]AEV95695.1 corA-like Mg2+ transporter family protein [Pediococcus claussenii ATCC BAA-344]ANZ69206.1 magnesium transporter [Pediococcus claussenii]ANZ71023.1 magnesium transporter [Pediococcus claussenii]
MLKTSQLTSDFAWIQVSNPTTVEMKTLLNKYGATVETLGYAVDRNERARTEIDEDNNIYLIIFDTLSSDFSKSGETEPISFMFVKNALISFTHESTNYVNKLLSRNIDTINKDNISVEMINAVLETLYSLTTRYLDAVMQINFERQNIQNKFKSKLNHAGIQTMLQLETSIIYLLTASKSNSTLLVGMSRTQQLQLTKPQQERLQDIIVESQQGQEMAQLASDIIEKVSNSYSNVLDNNLNQTMKFLTIFSIVLAVPNIVFGFYGQNVTLPFAASGASWILTIGISLALILIVTIVANWSDFFKK